MRGGSCGRGWGLPRCLVSEKLVFGGLPGLFGDSDTFLRYHIDFFCQSPHFVIPDLSW